MEENQFESLKLANKQYIASITLEQIKRLDAAMDAIDAKAGILLGFTALLLTLVLGSTSPSKRTPAELFFVYGGVIALLASILMNILSILPRGLRYDPKLQALLKYTSKPFEETLSAVSANLAEAWEFNSQVHERKVEWLKRAFWCVLAGLLLLFLGFVVRTAC